MFGKSFADRTEGRKLMRFKEKFIEIFKKKDLRNKILIAAAALGVILILLSELNFSSPKAEKSIESGDYAEYVSTLNDELTGVISSIDGVGECRVMITLKNTKESVYAENSDSSNSESSNSQNNEYVIYNSENGDSPLLLKEEMPQVAGVAVVCTGGDSEAVREKIIDCVCALFNISSSRVSVAKLNTKGGN